MAADVIDQRDGRVAIAAENESIFYGQIYYLIEDSLKANYGLFAIQWFDCSRECLVFRFRDHQ
jgi:hypothetical protein